MERAIPKSAILRAPVSLMRMLPGQISLNPKNVNLMKSRGKSKSLVSCVERMEATKENLSTCERSLCYEYTPVQRGVDRHRISLDPPSQYVSLQFS